MMVRFFSKPIQAAIKRLFQFMQEISAKIIKDSIGGHGVRLTTFQVRVPKFLLAELNTHRLFSRSYNSSRAIPGYKIRNQVVTDPYTPIYWGQNKPGMQALSDLSGFKLALAKVIYKSSALSAAAHHWGLDKLGLHKQHLNRIVEPYMMADGVITGCDWDNFFDLRCHTDAQPEFRELAIEMRRLMAYNEPQLLDAGDWHLPYITNDEYLDNYNDDLCMISAGRCARVSYGFTDTWDIEKDMTRARMLRSSTPPHLSPFEHVARCLDDRDRSGNFIGWMQYRKLLENLNTHRQKP